MNAVHLLGWYDINPINIDWLSGDPASYYIGWSFLRQESLWTYPLMWSSRLGYPLGVSLSYLDPVSLIAVLLHPISDWLPVRFQYFGIYMVINSILQFYFGSKLVYYISKDKVIAMIGGGLILLSPVFTWRYFGHFSLASHWMFLCGLAFYFRPGPDVSPTRYLLPIFLPVPIAASNTPYLAALCLLVALAACGRLVIERRLGLIRAALAFAGLLALVAAVMAIFGIILAGDGQEYSGGSYSLYTMNVLSVIDPQTYGSIIFKPQSMATAGQYEGYNYLGAGVILLLLFGLLSYPAGVLALRKPALLPILGLGLACIAAALSPKVTIGSTVLFDPQLPEAVTFLLSALRGVGRLFWPVHYLLIVAAVILVYRSVSRRHAVAVLLVGLALQAVDLHALRHSVRQVANRRVVSPLQSADWQQLGRHHKHLVVLPAIFCNQPTLPYPKTNFPYFGVVATEQGMTLNSYYAARYSPKQVEFHCHTLPDQVVSGQLDLQTAYVVDRRIMVELAYRSIGSHYCRRVDDFNLCTRENGRPGVDPKLLDFLSPNYRLGDQILFGTTPDSDAFAMNGWGNAGPKGIGTEVAAATTADLILRLDAPPEKDLLLTVHAYGFVGSVSAQRHQQDVDILINGREVGHWSFAAPLDRLVERSVRIPHDLSVSGPGQLLRIAFRVHNPEAPSAIITKDDLQRPGMTLNSLRLSEAE